MSFDLPRSYISAPASLLSAFSWLWWLRFITLSILVRAFSYNHILVWSSFPPRRVRSGLHHLRRLVARELYPTDCKCAWESIVSASWSQRCSSSCSRSRIISLRCRGHWLLRCVILDDARDHIWWVLSALLDEINCTLSEGQSLIIARMVLISSDDSWGSLLPLHRYSEFGGASSLVLLS